MVLAEVAEAGSLPVVTQRGRRLALAARQGAEAKERQLPQRQGATRLAQ